MKTSSLTAAFLACFASLPLLADDKEKPASPSVEVEGKAAKSESARIAQLEARVAQLEKTVEGLRKAGSANPARNSSQSGPTEEDRKRYESLSDAGKEKLRTYFREHVEELQKAGSPEERRKLVKAAFDKIEAEDKARKPD